MALWNLPMYFGLCLYTMQHQFRIPVIIIPVILRGVSNSADDVKSLTHQP